MLSCWLWCLFFREVISQGYLCEWRQRAWGHEHVWPDVQPFSELQVADVEGHAGCCGFFVSPGGFRERGAVGWGEERVKMSLLDEMFGQSC